MSEHPTRGQTLRRVVLLVVLFALVGGYVQLRLTSGTSWVGF